ncbi:MAG: 4-(cytidine 5'-diphospho)-2-C-methyl-D-erythritol kinase [Porticoccaceae bacterium]|jgi:4-diphosphocytidyl-2-C-methyl-D-erythritol kinase
MSLRLPAPAKLNLFLHIIGRRDDGYHLLQTVFQLLDYGDELSFDSSDDGGIHILGNLPGVATEDNLIYRAALLLQQQGKASDKGAIISLDKRLPVGGGIGGGSSDAATTLLGLNRLWALELSIDELAQLGLSLGADVPVFVRGHSAWAEGIGEQLTPILLPECWYLVIFPGCSVNTGQIFCHRELTRNDLAITIRAFLEAGGKNSCQPVAEKLYPEVAEARKWLENYAPAQMTGTGSCVFAKFASETVARRALEKLPGRWEGFVAKGINTSPAHTALTASV